MRRKTSITNTPARTVKPKNVNSLIFINVKPEGINEHFKI